MALDERLMAKRRRREEDAKRKIDTEATIWAVQWPIIITIICIILAQNVAAAGKVTITKTTEQLSTFKYKGTSLNGLLLGHIIIKIDLNKVDSKRNEMVKVQGALSKLPEDPKWSRNDKRLHSNFKGWMNHTIHNSIAKINTSLATFEETNLKLVDAPPRQKRQIIIGLGSLIVGGIIGVAYNYLHEEQVVDVLQKKEGIVCESVEDNMIKLNQEEHDLNLLGEALNDTITYTHKMAMGIKRLNIDQQYLNTMAAVNHFSHKMDDMVGSLEDLKAGKFNLNLLEMDALKTTTRKLDDQARLQNRYVAINTPFDLQKSPTSYAYNKTEHALYAIISVPLLSNTENMNLYSHLSIPVLTNDGKIMKISTEENFLGVSNDETKTKAYPNMNHCESFSNNYICPDSILYKREHEGCLEAIYFNNKKSIEKKCDIEFLPEINDITKVNASLFIATTSKDVDLTTKCGQDQPNKMTIKGTYLIHMDPDCLLTTTSYTITRPLSPPGIHTETTLLQNPLNVEDWIGQDDHEGDVQDNMEMIQDLMRDVGKPIKVSTIKTLSILQAKIKANDAQLSWSHSWFSFPGIIKNFVSTCMSFIPVIITIIVCYKLACCYWRYRQTRGGGGGGRWFSNRREEEQEMEAFQEWRNMPGTNPDSIPPTHVLPNWRQARSDAASDVTSTTTA